MTCKFYEIKSKVLVLTKIRVRRRPPIWTCPFSINFSLCKCRSFSSFTGRKYFYIIYEIPSVISLYLIVTTFKKTTFVPRTVFFKIRCCFLPVHCFFINTSNFQFILFYILSTLSQALYQFHPYQLPLAQNDSKLIFHLVLNM
jgi:hypothetical protein